MSWDEWACPLRKVVVDYDESGDQLVGETVDCRATLYVHWSFTWPLPSESSGHPYTGDEVAFNAYTDGWEVVCGEGHVLATHSRSADDKAEPFDLEAVMAAIGAVKITRS